MVCKRASRASSGSSREVPLSKDAEPPISTAASILINPKTKSANNNFIRDSLKSGKTDNQYYALSQTLFFGKSLVCFDGTDCHITFFIFRGTWEQKWNLICETLFIHFNGLLGAICF
jgi:hypothetical protein